MALTRRAVLTVSLLCLGFSCSAKPKNPPPTPAAGQGAATSKEAGMKKVETIAEESLRECLAEDGRVALVRVLRLEPFNQGTRGERVDIHVEVERKLHGELPRQVYFWAWGAPGMKPGHRLIIAARPPYEGTTEVEMIATVDVPEGLAEEAVQVHQQALEKLGKGPAPKAPFEIIEAEQLQGFLAEGACVALGSVRKVEAFNQGTRGARVRIHLEVERQLHGSLPRQVSFLTFGGPDTAKVGQQLLFAVKPPVPQLPDAPLLSFYTVPEGKAEEVARAQQEVLAQVSRVK